MNYEPLIVVTEGMMPSGDDAGFRMTQPHVCPDIFGVGGSVNVFSTQVPLE